MAINRDKVLREAEKLVQRGKIEQAIREYEKLLKVNPNDANTINRVGDLYGRIGQVEKAVELYERIAEYFTQDGFISKAIAILKKINRLTPDRLDIYDRLGELYVQQGLFVEARGQYQMLADWYAKRGDLDNVIKAQRKLVEMAADDHVAHLRLADSLMEAGQHEEALQEYGSLGLVLLERGKLAEADRLYRHVLELKPPDGAFLEPFCTALLDAGRPDEAREIVDTALRLTPGHPGLTAVNVRILAAEGRADEALEAAEQLLEKSPDDDELRVMVGGAALTGGEIDRARDLILPVVDRAIRRGQYQHSSELLRELVKAAPKDMAVLTRALRTYEALGNEDMTFAVKAALADRHYRESRNPQALQLYLELADRQPDNTLFRERINELSAGASKVAAASAMPVEAETGDVAEFGLLEGLESAAEGLEEAGSAQGGAPGSEVDPYERLAEANVFTKYGLVEKAIRHLEEIIAAFPDLTEAREKLVLLYVEEGRRTDARAAAKPLLESYRTGGDAGRLATLEKALGLPAAAPAATPEIEELEEEDVILLDIDEPEVEPIESGALRPPVPAGPRIVAPDLEPIRLPDIDKGDSRGSEGVLLELEELERSLAGGDQQVEAPPIDEAVADLQPGDVAEPAEVLDDPGDVEVLTTDQEELVDISGTFAGPSLDDLEQFDFYLAQELYEDALRILLRLEAEFPDDADLSKRRLILKQKGVILEGPPSMEPEQPEELFAEEEEYIDLARELEQELAAEEAMVEEATGHGKDEAQLEEVFREFQKGVAEQLSEEDSDTHFNLGIAYKEMGLLSEAIGEFQVASRDAGYFVESCSMIGVCYLEQGLYEQAAQWYRKALTAEGLGGETRLALKYDLGLAVESAGDSTEATEIYSEIVGEEPGFRDVAARLHGLREHRKAN